MSQQAVLADGGIKTAPKAHYDQNRPVYEYITERLCRVNDVFLSTDEQLRGELLRHATEYAVISVQTKVEYHEPAFVDSRGVEGQQELADVFSDYVVQYHNNKARFVFENRQNVDFVSLGNQLVDGEIDAVHESLYDDCLGLGSAKAAFSLAMLGFTSKICIDSHTANQAGMDRYASSDTSIEEYNQMSDTVLGTFTELSSEVEPFVYQWVLFDTDRGRVELHDPWFTWVAMETDEPLI